MNLSFIFKIEKKNHNSCEAAVSHKSHGVCVGGGAVIFFFFFSTKLGVSVWFSFGLRITAGVNLLTLIKVFTRFILSIRFPRFALRIFSKQTNRQTDKHAPAHTDNSENPRFPQTLGTSTECQKSAPTSPVSFR